MSSECSKALGWNECSKGRPKRTYGLRMVTSIEDAALFAREAGTHKLAAWFDERVAAGDPGPVYFRDGGVCTEQEEF